MYGRSSDLSLWVNAFPNNSIQWQGVVYRKYRRITAAGLFPTFTGFPFHRYPVAGISNRYGDKDKKNY